MNWALRAQVAFLAREYPEAIEFAQQATVFEPNFWIADYQRAMAYEQAGKNELALETLGKHLSAGPANSKLHSLHGYVLAKTGRHTEAHDVLNTLGAISRDRYVPPYARALVYAGLGDRAGALDWLEKAIEARDVHLIALPTDPKWDPLRRDPRFLRLLERCGFSKSRT
jgi:tetratricopeptide (TPR) repeat protein